MEDENDEATQQTGHAASEGSPLLRGRPFLRIFRPDRTDTVPLLPGQRTIIGRSSAADLTIADATLSRTHATLAWDAGRLLLRDHDSRNGTFVNERRVDDAIELRAGDQLRFGSLVVSLGLANDGAPAGARLVPYEDLLGALQHELTRGRAFGSSVALLFVRAASTEGGHISRWIAHLEATLREVDSVASFGLEAALVLLPETSSAGAVATAERLCEGAPGAAGLTVGVVTAPRDGATADELIDRAANLATGEASGPVRSPSATPDTAPESGLIVLSDAMREVERLVDRVAATSIPVLLHGETGTGKELVAHALVARSDRADGPFRSVNCGALAASLLESTLFGHVRGAFTGADRDHAGLFEQASGGTLFLDEVGELSPSAQAALLRVLEVGTITRVGGAEEISVDVRVIAATHRDLRAMADRDEFRLDLLYRLNTVVVEVPPLRARPEEIEPLARHFLQMAATRHRRAVTELSPEVVHALSRHAWPGNVRELRNVIERAVVISEGGSVELAALPAALRAAPDEQDTQRLTIPPAGPRVPFKQRVQGFERQLMAEALQRAGGNKTAAARELDMPLRTFMTKVKAYGLEPD